MWSLALKILSILGIILLCLLILGLTVLLLVLFCPVTYRGGGTASGGEYRVWLRFRWLGGLVRGTFSYPGDGGLQVRLLWKTMGGRKRKEESPPSSDLAQSQESLSEPDDGPEKGGEAAQNTPEQPTEAGRGSTPEQPTEAGRESAPQAAPDSGESGQKTADRTIHQENLQEKATGQRGMKERLTAFLELVRDRDNQELVRHGLFRLSRILRSLRPRFLRAQALVGLGEPDLTGYVYGIYWAVKPFLGKKCQVSVTPDFERRVIEGEAVLGGRVMAAVVLHHVVRVLLDRRLRRLIARLKTI